MDLSEVLRLNFMELRNSIFNDGFVEGHNTVSINGNADISYKVILKEYNGLELREIWNINIANNSLSILLENGQIIYLAKKRTNSIGIRVIDESVIDPKYHGLILTDLLK